MPLQKCFKSGMRGWRWGKEGKCFVGVGAKAKAKRQGRAIEANKLKSSPIERWLEFWEILIRAWQLRKVKINGTNRNIWEDV